MLEPAPTIDASQLVLPSFSRTIILDAVGSTNAYASQQLALADAVTARGWGELSLVATADQQSGRGRLDRVWTAPAGSALAVSFVVRPHANPAYRVPPHQLHWLTQLLALATTDTLRRYSVQPSIKWPNDILIGEKKCCGILSQLVSEPGGHYSVILGIGLNLNMTAEQLPVKTATSLRVETGHTVNLEEVLSHVAETFAQFARAFFTAEADPTRPLLGGLSLRERLYQSMSTLGKEVTVHLPGDQQVHGTAVDLGEDGEIMVRLSSGETASYSVGDVVHLRPRTDWRS